jgi:RimJ/RimL family protein N-acetyltransferase
MFQLRTDRLLLRDWASEDLPLVLALAAEPSVTRYQTWLRHSSEEHSRSWLEEAIAENEQTPREVYSLAMVKDGEPVGWFAFGLWPREHEVRFGYALLPEYWGRGYMTEALLAVRDFAFRSFQIDSMRDECEASNKASIRVMEKAGFWEEERWPDHDDDLDIDDENIVFRLTRDAWQQLTSAQTPSPLSTESQ